MGNDIKFTGDKHYEECIVQALIVDTNYAQQMTEVLNVDYFNIEYLKMFTKMLFSYYDKYKVFPSTKLLATMIKEEVPDDILKEQMLRISIQN